ncbi:MAG TPA: ankyrin repeat domain-containing protein [Blastocatellia bacterium]|nr:ankyrin repeat domain-containing protein [Blastocatellia bacterium]
MKQKLPTRRMREHPDLEQLKRQAKELLNAFNAGDSAAVAEINAHYDNAQPEAFALHDAQLVIARSYGFDSWPKLKAYVDGVTIARLVEAVRVGDVERVRTMLKARPELADMTVSYVDEHRAIHYAVIHRRPEIVRLVMENGANARAGIYPHRDATSAWTLARERGYDEIVVIIEQEEQRRAKPAALHTAPTPAPEFPDEAERTAVASGDLEWLRARFADGKLKNSVRWDGGGLLTVAVRNNRIEALEFLLDCGFDPDERVSDGEGDWIAYSQGYPLWHAAALGRHEMANLLLDRGADPNAHVDSSGSAVHSAYSHKQWQMVELLQKRGGIVTGDNFAIYRQTDLVRQMLIDDERGVLPQNARPSDKPLAEEVLRFGADGGATEVVRLALELIDWARDDPRWFRMLASPLSFWHHIPWLNAGNKEFDRESYLECFRLILNRCDVNVRGAFGRTILHEIAAMGDWVTEDEVAAFGRAVLEAGARLDRRDDILNSTPLGWACRWGRVQLVKLLLEHGANPDETDAEEWARPRSWAQKMGHSEIAQLL